MLCLIVTGKTLRKGYGLGSFGDLTALCEHAKAAFFEPHARSYLKMPILEEDELNRGFYFDSTQLQKNVWKCEWESYNKCIKNDRKFYY